MRTPSEKSFSRTPGRFSVCHDLLRRQYLDRKLAVFLSAYPHRPESGGCASSSPHWPGFGFLARVCVCAGSGARQSRAAGVDSWIWREEVERVLKDPRVRSIRILPAYHGYRLRQAAVGDLLELLEERGRRLIVSARLIDERHEYHALTIKPVATADLDAFLGKYRRVPVLVSGLLGPDIVTLTKAHAQLLADLSFAEWHETMRYLTAHVSARQLVFASHTPFLITAAAPAKFDGANLPKRVLQPIASGNLESFLDE